MNFLPPTLRRFAMTRLDWIRLIEQGFEISIGPPSPHSLAWKYRNPPGTHAKKAYGTVTRLARALVGAGRTDPDTVRRIAEEHDLSFDSLRWAIYKARKDSSSAAGTASEPGTPRTTRSRAGEDSFA